MLAEKGEILEARIQLVDAVPAGSVVAARLANIGTNRRNAVAVGENGTEYLLPSGAPGVTQGATLSLELTRERIPGGESWKRALARLTDQPVGLRPPLEAELAGRQVTFPGGIDELGNVGWEDLLDQARTGLITFAGGELRVSPTPAMTLIDVDGHLPPDELAVLGAAQAACAIRRLDIGGSIGIDLPTVASKAVRQEAAKAVDACLPQPFERTTVNGFGFVQIVRPRARASLVELSQDRPAFEARALLRRAALDGPGAKSLNAHPAVIAVVERRPEWPAALARQVGGRIELRGDPSLPMSGGYAASL